MVRVDGVAVKLDEKLTAPSVGLLGTHDVPTRAGTECLAQVRQDGRVGRGRSRDGNTTLRQKASGVESDVLLVIDGV